LSDKLSKEVSGHDVHPLHITLMWICTW